MTEEEEARRGRAAAIAVEKVRGEKEAARAREAAALDAARAREEMDARGEEEAAAEQQRALEKVLSPLQSCSCFSMPLNLL